ncbi:hypothetical protein OsccyDRAFT_4795 [Leptolyngbyaceae cyanobacterium JSC-12]|nr:hypothetical protein OsccyDRAFT_4795 [Leptolyngbyaceae cyanobacterium JSC-12]
MARYTGLFKIAAPVSSIQPLLGEILESCNFNIVYQTGDYLMAREIPGHVAYHQLVTVEVLVDRTTATDSEIQMQMVIKNEELPLQVENHCRQTYQRVSQAITDTHHWELIEAVAG